MMRMIMAVLALAMAPVEAAKLNVKRPYEDDFVYGADGFSEADVDDSFKLGAHEFIEAEEDSEIDDEDADDPSVALEAANDEATNFGEDA